MMKKPKKPAAAQANTPHSHKECPVMLTLSLIANKWSVRLLFFLLNADKNTMRFSELMRAMGGITQRELTKHLREFEKSGIVERTVYPQIPPRVEYTLTRLGHSLLKPIEELSRWAEKNGAAVQKKRQEFEA